jgi:hypothetical protein
MAWKATGAWQAQAPPAQVSWWLLPVRWNARAAAGACKEAFKHSQSFERPSDCTSQLGQFSAKLFGDVLVHTFTKKCSADLTIFFAAPAVTAVETVNRDLT